MYSSRATANNSKEGASEGELRCQNKIELRLSKETSQTPDPDTTLFSIWGLQERFWFENQKASEPVTWSIWSLQLEPDWRLSFDADCCSPGEDVYERSPARIITLDSTLGCS